MFSAPPEALLKQWESEQDRLRLQLIQEDSEDWQSRTHFSGLERVAGVDLSYIKGDHVHACAQLAVLSYPELQVLYEDSQMVALTAPYIAGFLAFRETPFLLDALKRLEKNRPDLVPQVVFVDGNGLFHYREFGLACHLGVLSGLPCVGVAKNLLQVQGVRKSEEHQAQVAALKKGGDSFPLTAASGKVLGKALRSSDSSSKPVYVSVGHKISVDTAVRLTHSCCRYRIPEPIRQRDALPRFLQSRISTLSTILPILSVGDITGSLPPSQNQLGSELTSLFGGRFTSLTSLRPLKLQSHLLDEHEASLLMTELTAQFRTQTVEPVGAHTHTCAHTHTHTQALVRVSLCFG
ncbi:endonuclease V-like isoform X4 [Takifugu flavidus]|uniref:endonuclease V-like isoform X4 n=1 Tax=Takifugu flavidus TaxID=433684 RepID=UPI00254433D6|nr:endonuclease V-like isoform X4 [Takifugu flavidus]